MTAFHEHSSRFRRGNALLLVSGLLVMLTLIAAAYLSRSRTQRVTAAAVHETAADGTRANLVAQQLAADVAQHLFLRPVDPNSSGAGIVGGNSAAARKPSSPHEMRYGVEGASTFVGGNGRGDMLADALAPANPLAITTTPSARGDGWPDGYNFAPYAVVPWTNWPDHFRPVDLDAGGDPTTGRFFPFLQLLNLSLGTPAEITASSVASNPLGNPGFGDTRWLRSSEPVRMTQWTLKANGAPTPVPDGAFFSHWPHLSFPATANNGWRVVPDIGDIEGHARAFGETNGTKYVNPSNINFLGGALSNDMSSDRDGLGTPYEQWLPQLRPTPIPTATGAQPLDNDQTFVGNFASRRNGWFQRAGYLNTMNRGTQASMLPNLFKLDDPLGVGRSVDPAADPVPASDEYVENSPRNVVARTFADADGDGWTDSFWFLVPAGQEKNVRTVVGVSIVDNAGMVDLNVATRADRHTTIGFTPADLALVTSEPEGADMGSAERPLTKELGSAPWTDTRVGLLDSPRNFTRGRFTAGDPRLGFNPSGTEPSLYDLTGFEQAFDPYRWAGRPTPQIPGQLKNGISVPIINDGEPTLLSSLGLWFDAGDPARPELNFWNGYLHSNPRSALRDPLASTPPISDLAWATVREQLREGPWRASAPPGTASRWSQSEPLFAAIASGGNPSQQASWRWESWIDSSFISLNSAPNPNGRYMGSPFMRPEERTRWFRHAVTGELRAYGPFAMGTDLIDATELLVPNASVPREFLGESMRTRPFDATDEIELRAFGGLNDPGNMSRLERALNGEDLSRDSSSINDTLLRSTVLRGESGTAGAQLSNAQWVKDLRRKMTVVSGQRNELMPPHLWVGRSYLAESRAFPNRWETYQNATLWLDLHPSVPGPVDEDGDGVISTTELQWGSYDLMRVTTSDDPFPDGIRITRGSNPQLSPSDWARGVSIFEHLNRKFDLRRPLVNQRRLEQWDLEQLPGTGANAKPFLNEYGLVDENGRPRMAYAYSVQEQRRAMIDFALNVRQRLRPALRSVAPQRQRTSQPDPYLATLNALGPRQASTAVDGTVNVAYASYTDRFLDQLRLGFSAKVAGAVTPERRNQPLAAQQVSLTGYLPDDTTPALLAELGWRSAWSTEALTASLAANLATWRSRPDLIRENIPFPFVWPGKLGWGTADLVQRFGTDVPLRPVWQPILPWFESGAAQQRPDGNPYFLATGAVDPNGLPIDFTKMNHRPDYGDSPVRGDVTRKMREFASPQAIRAVDPAKFASDVPNASVPAKAPTEPDENTADLVFPGNEKHPFLTECFFSWVYPATTFDDPNTAKLAMPLQGRGWGSYRRYPNDLPLPSPDAFDVTQDNSLSPIERAALTTGKYVAVVTGQVGAPRLVPDVTDPRDNELDPTRYDPVRRNLVPSAMAFDWSRGLWKPSPTSTPGRPTRNGATWIYDSTGDFDPRRDELNEIRTPVLVVQVANPWNEPLRLGDFRLNIFGNLYDFPDYELDENGQPVRDAFGVPVPLMLPPATEFQPATATVYLIADVVGNEGNDLLGLAQRIDVERLEESDLADVAMYDPLFRRRWLDYLDLYEYNDGANLKDANGNPLSRAVVRVARVERDRSTSPRTSCLFAGPVDTADTAGSLPRSKLLNAMDRSDDAISGTGTKRRITDLWKFKNSLTPDAMRQGVVLERILRDPSGRNGTVSGTAAWPNRTQVATNDYTNRFRRTAAVPAESTIDRFRLRFWPASSDTNVFPPDSRAPETIFPPRVTDTTTNPPTRTSPPEPATVPQAEPTTLVVDRFDADDDFNHWTTVVNSRMGFDSSRGNMPTVGTVAVDPIKGTPVSAYSFTGVPLTRPEDQRGRFFENAFLNQDRSLVTGGRFWTACAQITLPPTRVRWPDGRDRRMVPYPADWIMPPAGQANTGTDQFWHDWSMLPSAPVLLGSTMIVRDRPSPVMLKHFLSRLQARRDLTGALSYRLGIADAARGSNIAVGEGEWFLESELFDATNPANGFDFNAPRGQLDDQELASICTSFPHLDRDRDGVPDDVQKVFIGFDEPEGSLYSFPPATAASLNRDVTFYQFNPVPADLDIPGEAKPYYPPVRGWPYSGSEPAFGTDGVDRTPGYRGNLAPGINLRTATESRDYFTTWTRVSRSWSRLFDAKLATCQEVAPQMPPASGGFNGWAVLQRPGSLLARQADIAGSGSVSGRRATYQGTGGNATASLQGNEVANRPMWDWTRQMVNTSATGDPSGMPFKQVAAGVDDDLLPWEAGVSDSDGNLRARFSTPANLTAFFGAFGPDRLAPRFVFANRTEPERYDRPVDMRLTEGKLSPANLRRGDSRPVRQELMGYQGGRYPASFIGRAGYKGETGSPLVEPSVISRSGLAIYRAPLGTPWVRSPENGGLGSSPRESYQWISANDGELLSALGDTFAMDPPLDPSNPDDANRRPRDPDVWVPDPVDPGRTVATATAAENDLRWMDNVRSFNWLTRPVVAPLPDLQGLGWSAGGGGQVDRMASVANASDALPYAAFPELVMRKPTGFNCQTVIDDRTSRDMAALPYTGPSTDFTAASPVPAYRRFLYAKYANFIPNPSDGQEFRDGVTRFLYPAWARPAARPGEFAASSNQSFVVRQDTTAPGDTDGDGQFDDTVFYGMDLYPDRDTDRLSIYRVYMGDKGGRLLDHQGRHLVLDRVTMRPAQHDGDLLQGQRLGNGATDDSSAALFPVANLQKQLGLGQWRMQGVWNTLDRMPHEGSLQMLHKDDDFEQLGELADVFLWGPAYRVYRNPQTEATAAVAEWSPYNVDGSSNGRLARGGWLRPTDLQTTVDYNATSVGTGNAFDPIAGGTQPAAQLIPPRLVSQCRATFAEIMSGRVPGFPVGEGPMVNRLQVDPPNVAFHQPASGNPYASGTGWGVPRQYGGTGALSMPYGPSVPWGMRVFDAFTLDGPGGVLRYDWSDQFAGRSVEMNPSSTPSPGAIALTTGAAASNVFVFENSGGFAGNPAFAANAQDGGPAVTGLTHRMTAARPAGALVPVDVYRDSVNRASSPHVAFSTPVVTRASMAQWEHDRTPSLSGGYRGLSVPGLLNVNTATVEALRSLPHMNQMVYDDTGRYRLGGSPQFSLHTTASEAPYGQGLAGALPPAAGNSPLNTDGQYRNISAAVGDRGQNPTTKLPEAISIYRDNLNPNTLLATSSASATVTDWYVRDFNDPMEPATGGSSLGPSGAARTVSSSFPVYPSYVDRGEGADADAQIGTGLTAAGQDETGARRDPFAFVHYNRGMRATPGIATIGEIIGIGRGTRTRLNNDGSPAVLPAATGFAQFPDWQYDQSWSARLAGLDPFRKKRFDIASGQGWQSYLADPDGQLTPDPLDARLSTDRQGVRTFEFSTADRLINATGAYGSDGFRDLTVADAYRVEPDAVAGDSEERNMLFKGISNMVSTRSDVFTAYFRVKTVKQGADGRWNAMDPETLLSEARYVMCIDRSNVNRPTDKPRIVYFTKVND